MKELTQRQSQIIKYIKTFYRKNGLPPTVRELGDKFNMKSSSMFDHLTALEKKGFVIRPTNKSRSLKLTEFVEKTQIPPDFIEIPVMGRVSAGQPLLAVENLETTVSIDTDWVPGGTIFGLKVKGDSMIDAHILEGDVVLVKKQTDAVNKDIVVALVGEEATVKTYYKEKTRIRLQPENKSMKPIYVNPKSDEFKIVGKVVGVLRKF